MRDHKRSRFKSKILCFLLACVVACSFMPVTASAAAFSTSNSVTGTKVASYTYSSVTLSWKTYPGATGYDIYKATSENGKYTKIKRTSKNYYKRTNLTTNYTCYYKVRAVYSKSGKKTKYSKFGSKIAGTPRMSTPKATVSAAGGGVKVSWNKISGAKGYQLYRATSENGNYSKIKTTHGLNSVDDGTKTGVKYYYQVRAYRTSKGNTKYSSFSEAKSGISALEKTSVTAEQGDGCINVSWKAVSGATGYELVRATSPNGSYSTIATTSGASYKDSKVTDGQTYYYKVRAYSKNSDGTVYGAFSSGKYSAADVIKYAEAWSGYNEKDGSYKKIIDIYNSVTPLPSGYKVKYTDEWCATYVSAVAIKAGTTDIMPRECSCQRMIKLYMGIDSWVEDDAYKPSPGDVIFYDWTDGSNYSKTDNKNTSHHVGIVTSVSGDNVTTVIEGNKREAVGYRTVKVNGRYIRGYGVPKYDSAFGITYEAQDTGLIRVGHADEALCIEGSEEAAVDYDTHLSRIKTGMSARNLEYDKAAYMISYIRTKMKPDSTVEDKASYYSRLVFDISNELGIMASIEWIPDEDGQLCASNILTLDGKAYSVNAAGSGKFKSYKWEEDIVL